MNFEYRPLPWNIIFGAGTLERLPDELKTLGLSRALILTTPGQMDNGVNVANLIEGYSVGHFDGAKMHVPVATVEAAQKMATETNADCCISIGGGSTTGLGKALALKMGIANITIPTTYSGSEMTNIWGMTENNRKVTGRDDCVVPDLIIYDPTLTLSLPTDIIGPSAINAMAQAVVNVATDTPNPMVGLMAEEAIRRISASLPTVISNPEDITARADLLYGASLAGGALGTGSTSLHHKLCHTFGGTFNTPHAETHTILLPHAVAYNAHATKQGTQKVAEAMGAKDAASGIQELAKSAGAPTALKDIGIKYNDLDEVVSVIMAMDFANPAPIVSDRLRKMLENAYHGHPPVID